MNNDLVTTTISDNYEEMAKAMGIAGSSSTDVEKKSANQLARLRLNHAPIMGTEDVNGKSVNVEKVPSGTYKLDVPDDATYYQGDIEIKAFMQRYMYKRFIKGTDNTPNRFIKTVMADNLTVDLKDNDGGHNCGKPAGYIQDFNALPDKQKDLIRQIKRVRVIFGLAKFDKAQRVEGNSVTDADLGYVPFIWEIDNKEAFKTVGSVFEKLYKLEKKPHNHVIYGSSEERKLPNGNSYYVPSVRLDLSKQTKTSDEDHVLFGNLLGWVTNYNQYIMGLWNENVHSKEDIDTDMVDSFIDITNDEKVQ